MKLKGMCIFFFLVFSLYEITLHGAEEKSKKRKREWKDLKVYKNRNFNKAFPDLAVGFRLIDENLQDFMMERLEGHYVYEAVKDLSPKQVSILDDVLKQAEKKMVIALQRKLEDAFYDRTDFSPLNVNMLQYVSHYKDTWGGEVIQSFTDNSRLFFDIILRNDIKKTKFLIDLGVHVDAQSRSGWTPLHYAAGQGRATIVRMLSALPINIENNNNNYSLTPLQFAFKRYEVSRMYFYKNEQNYRKTIKSLIAAGAKNTIRSQDRIETFFSQRFTSQVKKFIAREIEKRDNPQEIRPSLPRQAKERRLIS